MTVYDLNRDQLEELKQHYLMQKMDERGETPSYEELAFVDDYVSDAEIYAEYSGVNFVPDDFASSAGQDEDYGSPMRITIDVFGYRDAASACQEVMEMIQSGMTRGYGTYCTFETELL